MKISFGVILSIFGVWAAESHGWTSDKVTWVTLDEAKEAAKTNGKPTMLLIHKSWCGACKALKPQFAKSTDIEDLSVHFNMVNALDDDEPADDIYKPDGGYIPRVLFVNPDGNVMNDVINEGGNAKYKYFYSRPDGIVASMKRVMKMFSSEKDEL